ncbi:lariat debranching enzyme, C-terminal domain-containing protein [Aspergillus varians]
MSDSGSSSVRVAVEGCGHGCLHDIYASVEKAATLKGWDAVDLLIIGGDFQAVRNSNDMACMSVPDKYKEIGDFHEYYSGKRTAPYLTIFIGGNHEASNHLFELYHGGWVAPNIYYLGAANVLRFGPLRISGFSGIWKGYDYRKPHFERIPYNREDLGSVYHVRELDIRKLLQIRTQVDLGLSHDWPKQVEYSGDWQQLFNVKPFFREDSQSGKLGSSAAQYVLERLRPAYWFSAHLHVKFAASVQHPPQENDPKHHCGLDGASFTSMVLGEEDEANQQPKLNQAPPQSNVLAHPKNEDKEAQYAPAVDSTQQTKENIPTATVQGPVVTEAVPPQSNAENTPELLSAWKNFHHIAAKKEAAENSRFLSEQGKNQGSSILNIQHNLTWRKVDTDEDGLGRKLTGVEKSGPRENKKQKVQHETQPVKNSDEIDLDLDSDSGQEQQKVQHETQPVKNSDEIDLDLDSDQEQQTTTAQPPTPKATTENTTSNPKIVTPPPVSQSAQSEVSEDLRKQLPSSFFAPQPTPQVAAIKAPFPKAITNTTTNFLALDKCLPKREFLQLVEINAVSDTDGAQLQRPFHLAYDKEWLAITRVFAGDLQLGDPAAKPPSDKGQATYQPLIEEEEKWVEEHIVKPGKLAVPENFTLTAPVYDPEIPVTTDQQPPEYNNPQTAAFCELVGIENKFHLTDEERDARMATGPRPCDPPTGRRGRGGYGGRGGGGGSRGRGRGRGYGRGFNRGGHRW